MLYAIKADKEIVYIGQVECPSEEEWVEEYNYHKCRMLEAHAQGDDLNAPEDFYFWLNYWKEAEGKSITMSQLDIGDADEQWALKFLISVLKPVGNTVHWEM